MENRTVSNLLKNDSKKAEKLSSVLADWANFYRGRFYSLGSKKRLDRGLELFESELLGNVTFDPESRSIGGSINDGSNAKVAARLVGEDLEPACTCETFTGGAGTCDHLVALVAFLFRISQGRSFGLNPPSDDYVNRLFENLLASSEGTLISETAESARPYSVETDGHLTLSPGLFPVRKDGSDPRASIALVKRYSFFVAYWMGDPSGEVLGKLKMTETWERPEPTRTFFLPEDLDELLKFVQVANEAKVETRIYVRAHLWVRLTGVLTQRFAPRQYRLDRKGLEVSEMAGDFEDPGVPALVMLAEGIHLLADGDLVYLARQGSDRVGDIFHGIRNMKGSAAWEGQGANQEETVELETFNSFSLLYPLKSGQFLAEGNRMVVDEKKVGEPGWKMSEPVEFIVELERDEMTDTMEVLPQLVVDGYLLPIELLVEDQLESDFSGFSIDPRLVSAKRRRKILLDALITLFSIEKKADRRAYIQRVSEDASFAQLRLGNKAKRYLNRFQRNWVEAGKEKYLLAHPERGWLLIESPLRRLAILFVGLLKATGWVDDGVGDPSFSAGLLIEEEDFPEMLHAVTGLATATGARIRMNREDVESRAVDFAIDVTKTGDIDWFELKPDVRCGQFSIPRDEWRALIRGDLLVRDEGRLVVPKLDSAGAAEALMKLLGSPEGKRGAGSSEDDAGARVPRLEILDWLAMRKNGVRLNLPDEIESIFQSLDSFDRVPRRAVPKALAATLRDYQQRGFEWLVFLYEHRFGACLADDMGLGKTVQAIALLSWRKSSRQKRVGPHLVVVPPSLLFNWQHELAQFCKDLKVAEYHGSGREIAQVTNADVVLTSYELVRRDIEELSEIGFDIVIFDEAQTLKNLRGERTRAALRLRRRFSLCLTGTPLENHVDEYFSVMNLALAGIFGDYKGFREKMKRGKLAILERATPFILRRTKSAILKELPDKVESDFYLEMTGEQKEIYTRTVAEVRAEVAEAYGEKTQAQAGIVALAALTRLRQICVSPEILGQSINGRAPKIDYLVGKLGELVAEGHSVLVFSQFVRSLDLLEEVAKSEGLSCLRLDGSVPAHARKERVNTFQNGKDPAIFLISLRAGGVGLNLTRAQYVFHLDPWWNPAVENQATDRAHRIGQKESVFVQRILMKGSVEEKIMELKRRKRAIFDSILGDEKEAKGTMLTKADFDALLQG